MTQPDPLEGSTSGTSAHPADDPVSGRPGEPVDEQVDEATWEDELDEPAGARLGSRRWWIIGLLLIVPATALLVWIGVMNAKDAVTHRVVGYQVVDDRTVTVDFDVQRPVGWTVSCEVQAMDVRFGTVGTVHVTVPATQGEVTRQHATVRTTARAVTGTVKLCTRA